MVRLAIGRVRPIPEAIKGGRATGAMSSLEVQLAAVTRRGRVRDE